MKSINMNYFSLGRLHHWRDIVKLQGLSYTVRQTFRRFSGQQSFRRYPISIDGGNHWITVRVGTSDTAIYDQVFVRAEYSSINSLSVQPKSIIDAGANVGFATVYFKKYIPGSNIVSFEPDKENYHLLVQNTSGLSNVVTVCGAVWGESCMLSMSHEKFRDGSACALTVSTDPGTTNAYSIEDIISKYDLCAPILVKIDIEGAETNLFQLNRADKWLGKVDVVIMEVHEDSVFGDPTEDIEDSMLNHGFTYTTSGELRVYTRA